jgi:hypothetical protein
LLKFFKRNLNYIRLNLNKGKFGILMVITHEHGGSNKFSKFGYLRIIFS